jgi:hypothetical protein
MQTSPSDPTYFLWSSIEYVFPLIHTLQPFCYDFYGRDWQTGGPIFINKVLLEHSNPFFSRQWLNRIVAIEIL